MLLTSTDGAPWHSSEQLNGTVWWGGLATAGDAVYVLSEGHLWKIQVR
jgi:hypothetical protein